jgi:hypothetical protein
LGGISESTLVASKGLVKSEGVGFSNMDDTLVGFRNGLFDTEPESNGLRTGRGGASSYLSSYFFS